MKTVECIALNPSIDVSSQCKEIQATHKTRLQSQSVYPGGGAVNVARVIKLLGGKSYLKYVAGGETGNILTKGIDSLSIPSHRIDSNIDTRISFNVIEQQSGLEYRFVPKGSTLPDATINAMNNQVASLSAHYLVLSGSIPEATSAEVYARMAMMAASKGAKVFVDCSGPALSAALESKSVFLAKPSLSELSQLAGHDLDEKSAIDFALSLIASGSAENVAVSMGGKGAFLVNKSRIIRAAAVEVPVRSAVGAGDSFLAGMIYRITCLDTMENALRWGMATGASAVTTPGTKLCEPRVVNEVLPLVEVITTMNV